MAKLAQVLWMNVEWSRPDPAEGSPGAYTRDVEMVRGADLVLAFFSSPTMTGGTAHVVEKAQDAGTPVYSWGLDGDTFVRIGEHDPGDAWGQTVPA